jgi:tetratricopeptide (TPR) repeat protein
MRRSRPGPQAANRAASVETLLTEGAGHYAEGRLDDAMLAYERAETAAPDDVRAIYSLAVIEIRRGRFISARRRLRIVVRSRPDLFGAQHNLGVAEQALGAWAEAAAAYAAALRLKPDAAETHFSLANALAVLGQIEEAQTGYRTLAASPATRLRALTRLAFLAPGDLTPDDIDDLAKAASDPAAPVEARAERRFALGEILEASGDHDLAFDAFAEANALEHAALSAGPPERRPRTQLAAHAASADRVREVFTRDFLSRHADEGDGEAAPIFIVGMPRSGSSLIEQILASHPGVQGLGETLALGAVLDGPFPYGEGEAGPRPFARLAQAYLDAITARGWSTDRASVDKTLENHLHVGAIHLMFPRAIILHSLRDPVDTCLACYRQNFATGAETLYDLGEIGAEYVRYRQIMDHWRALLPGRIIDVRYEDLVADPATKIPWLVTEACRLTWHAACLQFHQTPRPVLTASAAQVRRPIYRSSVARWRRHQHRLGPLLEALGPYAPPDL